MSVRMVSRVRQWWRQASLIQRLVLVAMVPSAVSTMFLAVLLTQHQIRTTRELVRSTASAYVAQAAAMAADPMLRNDLPDLQRLVDSISELPHVNRVTIIDPGGNQLVSAQAHAVEGDTPQIHMSKTIRDVHTPSVELGTLQVDFDTENSLLAQHVSIFDTLLWLGIAIMLAILLSWQQASWISAPLRRLSLAMRGLGSIDRPQSVRVTDESEIGDLQRGFNTAAATLHALHRDMERRIEDATEELARKNAALEQASKAKARFLASATHDLRQPLYALTLFSSALADKETDPERLDRIAHVQQCIDSLDRLFGELLDLSRLEAGVMQPEMRDFALDEVFQEVSRNFRIQAENQELRLVTRPTRLWVHTDRTMLARILNNLVSNALRYTHEGGVLVGARKRGERIRIDVCDTGTGIPDEYQAHIFEEFFRIEQTGGRHPVTPAAHRGLGLGLSTVKRLTELLDTQCILSSVPGRGSQFTLMVPASRTAAPEAPALPARIRRAEKPSHELEGLRVLVIEDDRAILAGMRDLLGKWGCKVHAANDCAGALTLAAEMFEAPDLVISDLHLGGGCDGVEAMQKVAHQFGATGGVAPFARLLITGETEQSRLQQAHDAKLPILFKPVSPQAMRRAILALLQRRGKSDDNELDNAHEGSSA